MNFKEALIAHLQGEKVDVLTASERFHDVLPPTPLKWRAFGSHYYGLPLEFLQHLASLQDDGHQFRLAPRTIFVNGVEVPAPEIAAPAIGDVVWIADPCGKGYLCYPETWSDHAEQIELLSRKLVHKTKEDAITRARAMLLTSDK